ncbi:MAG: alpha-ketoglutarate-dependent dioxygenase AlkB, partial [Pseudomonadota bacterium]
GDQVQQQTKAIADLVKEKLKGMGLPRYKYCVQCVIGEQRGEGARMGLHRDDDEGEAAFAAPVVSLSLGDPARFRMGGTARSDPTTSTLLHSGDVLVMGGPARLAYHGVDRVLFGQGTLLPDGGRINLTLRVVASA